MKHRPRFALACAVAALAVSPSLAFSALVMSEPFSYPDGNLIGQGGWALHSGLITDKPILVTGGAIRLNQSAGSGQDVNRPHAAFAATSTSYAMFKLTVPSIAPGGGAPVHATADYFAHARPSINPNNFRARVYVGPPTGGGNFGLYISVTSSGTSPPVAFPTDLSYNTQYTVVTSYDPVAGTSQMWVNPTSSASTSATSGPFALAAGEAIDQYAFRQAAVTTTFQDVDDLEVHSTFPIVPSLPGANDIALALMAIAMLGTGAVTVVRARANA